MSKKTITNWLLAVVMIAVGSSALQAHCEIPCGIYNDQMRIVILKEHVTTIEKSMNQIVELSKAGEKNYNQLVRWVVNKEDHANQFQDVVTQYFMTQRIKPVDAADAAAYAEYTKKTLLLHQMLVYAMKAKQTTYPENCTTLRSLIDQFVDLYFDEEARQHLKEHHE